MNIAIFGDGRLGSEIGDALGGRSGIRPLILGAAHPHALNQGSVRLILRRIR